MRENKDNIEIYSEFWQFLKREFETYKVSKDSAISDWQKGKEKVNNFFKKLVVWRKKCIEVFKGFDITKKTTIKRKKAAKKNAKRSLKKMKTFFLSTLPFACLSMFKLVLILVIKLMKTIILDLIACLTNYGDDQRAELIILVGITVNLSSLFGIEQSSWLTSILMITLFYLLESKFCIEIGKSAYSKSKSNFLNIVAAKFSMYIIAFMALILVWILHKDYQVIGAYLLDKIDIIIALYVIFSATIWLTYFSLCKFVLSEQLKLKSIVSFYGKTIKTCFVSFLVGLAVMNFILGTNFATESESKLVLQVVAEFVTCAITFIYPILDMLIYTNDEKNKHVRLKLN